MNKNKILIVVLMVLIAGVIVYFTSQNKTEGLGGAQQVKIASNSDFIFKTVNGETIELSVADKEFHIKGMDDKIVFLKVFGWECKFCQKEIPELVKLKKELGDSFEVVAIEAQQHSDEMSRQKIKEYGINYHIVSGENQKEFYAYLQEKYGWTGIIPLTIVVAKGGAVLAFELGAKSYSLSELMQASLLRD